MIIPVVAPRCVLVKLILYFYVLSSCLGLAINVNDNPGNTSHFPLDIPKNTFSLNYMLWIKFQTIFCFFYPDVTKALA